MLQDDYKEKIKSLIERSCQETFCLQEKRQRTKDDPGFSRIGP